MTSALVLVTAVGLALSLAGAPRPAAPARETAPQQSQTYVDPLYGFQLSLPASWHVSPSPAGAVLGAAVFFSYDPEQAQRSGGPPPGSTRIQVGLAPISPAIRTADWAARWLATQRAEHTERGEALLAALAESLSIGGREAVSTTLSGPMQPPVVEIDLRLASGQLAVIGITADGPDALREAVALLAGIAPAAGDVFTAEARRLADAWWDAEARAASGALAPGSPSAACVAGTFPGDEAPDSPIALHMPVEAGQRWMVGGWGYFYGNVTHCNSNNDYYATDWNRVDASDDGAPILPVADGVVSAAQLPTCPTTGYGCYVRVDHAGGVRTVYAHLKGVYRASGTVTHADALGACGSTGNSSGSHLHLGFRVNNGGTFSHCFNGGATCPNGEAPLAPQSPKPSPMWTSGGLTVLTDGAIFTSANRPDEAVKLYAAPGLTGTLVYSGGVGFSSAPARDAGSMALPPGWSAITWRTDDATGEQRCWPESAADLSAFGWQDAIDAIEAFDHDACPPAAPQPLSPPDRSALGSGQPVTLTWSSTGAAHYGEVLASGGATRTFGWLSATAVGLGPLPAGQVYTWRVMARNQNGPGAWSAASTFLVAPPRTFLPLALRDWSPYRVLFADPFTTNTLSAYQAAGAVAWDSIQRDVVFGDGGGMLYRSLSLPRHLVLGGRLRIPADGAGPYDSLALAVRGASGGAEYWITLAYGAGMAQAGHLSIMRNDAWGDLHPIALAPGWYRVQALIDADARIVMARAWPDGTAVPAWQVSRPLDAGWSAAQVGFRHFGAGAHADDLTVLERR
jgi:hypothetical protein